MKINTINIVSSVFYLNNILIVDIVFKSILILILKISIYTHSVQCCGKSRCPVENFFQKISEKIFMQDCAPKNFRKKKSTVIPVHLGRLYTMKGDFSIFADESTIHYEWRFLKILRIIIEN